MQIVSANDELAKCLNYVNINASKNTSIKPYRDEQAFTRRRRKSGSECMQKNEQNQQSTIHSLSGKISKSKFGCYENHGEMNENILDILINYGAALKEADSKVQVPSVILSKIDYNEQLWMQSNCLQNDSQSLETILKKQKLYYCSQKLNTTIESNRTYRRRKIRDINWPYQITPLANGQHFQLQSPL